MVELGLFSLREGETKLVMDFAELTKIIYTRLQRFEPDNTARIFGCIFLRAPDEQEMMQLAYGSDATLISYINEAKADLSTKSPQDSSQIQSHNYPLTGTRYFSSNNPDLHIQSHLFDSFNHYNYTQKPNNQFMGFDEPYDNTNNLSRYLPGVNMYHDPLLQRRLIKPSMLVPKRPCHYYVKGTCKNGANCSYSHHNISSDSLESDVMGAGAGMGNTPVSLEKLEMEIVELLRSNTGQPVSIASLPTLYGQMYGKGLQADGYLTESQRHGKAGYSLTKLLCRLNKIAVIERPHGQHAVVLAEDAFKYVDSGNEKFDGTQNSANQIYLTFPADSMFTEEDVHAYFSQYGLVRDVRIPCQDRRMFGFVSFHSPETVHLILANRHPHFISGARVLVKPYREKARHSMEKMKPQLGYNLQYTGIDPDIYPMPGESGSSLLIKRQLYQEKLAQLESEMMRLNELGLNPLTQISSPNCKLENHKYLSDQKEFDLIDPVRYALDALNNCATSIDDNSASAPSTNNSCIEQDSCPVELPENPFGIVQ
ncbi:CCCH-type zinc fingerfamily protein with RNA-binding domain-containing protein [Rhynchospora pubera]|uniref:CCCH-type zinc fingerfamily protein with RNA-binding domain-containing protein n=1 Tax=Rhynchospora pubera TaxID=906938 RepID=A0AAV8D5M1_9POAL|nr:CCCH-type zinc fingerfamily protein with RNA-binding domain-containing protein [Rhynchospora pubera]KAJ4815250.1 CCCH-type zinc fingerfamily protein with RNA-binding domain-containing protein [Rhynchospora pubera]